MISSVKWGRTGAAMAVLIAILTPTHAAGLAFQSALEDAETVARVRRCGDHRWACLHR